MGKQYVIYIEFYDNELGHMEGFGGIYKKEANPCCNLRECEKFPSKDAADAWFCKHEEDLTGDVHDYFDYRIIPLSEAENREKEIRVSELREKIQQIESIAEYLTNREEKDLTETIRILNKAAKELEKVIGEKSYRI